MELRNRGICLNHKTVQKADEGIRPKMYGANEKVSFLPWRSRQGRAKSSGKRFPCGKTESKVGNRCDRVFLFGNKLYLSPVLDLYNGEIISYAISDRANYRQVEEMLDKAFSRLPDGSGLIFHSDQGWQYQNARYQKKAVGKRRSAKYVQKGNCLDNAVMENFFGLLKSEFSFICGHSNHH